MKGSGRSRKPVRQPGGLDWIKKRPVPIINVLIADSDRKSRAACIRTLQGVRGVRIVGEAATGLEAVSATAKQLVFEFSVRVRDDRPDGTPNFLGPFPQGPAGGRFVCLAPSRELTLDMSYRRDSPWFWAILVGWLLLYLFRRSRKR